MSETSPDRAPRMKLWLRVLLISSLALNVLVVGAVVGAAYKRDKWRGHHHAQHSHMFGGPLTRALNEEDRHALHRKMRKVFKKNGDNRAARRAEMHGLIEEIKKTPFDPQSLSERLTRLHALVNEKVSTGQDLLVERVTQMSDAERAAFASRLEENFNRRKH